MRRENGDVNRKYIYVHAHIHIQIHMQNTKKILTWNLEVLCEESLNREDKSQDKIQMNICIYSYKQSLCNTKALNSLNKTEVLEACDDSGGAVESTCFLKEIVKMRCGE